MTTRDEEMEVQRQWKLKPRYAQVKEFERLVDNEFLPVEQQEKMQGAALSAMAAFASSYTDHFAEVFWRLKLEPRDIRTPGDLTKLPMLTKGEVLAKPRSLMARALPAGEKAAGMTKSSGTTGQPVTVVHTRASNNMFTLLRQRHGRWYRLNPLATRVEVRTRTEIGSSDADAPGGADGIIRRSHWRYLGRYFETGCEYAFPLSTPMEQQIPWLQELKPQYAASYPGVFEEWLLANDGRPPCATLEALLSSGSQLTPALRTRLEESYGIPIRQSYGLNEIGIVAVQCEAGRYHVHSEHCLVEIVTADGAPCAAGATGHLLVTGLRNHAMPLLRYNTGDLAEAAAGPCACGRTLPSFGAVAGRFRRYAGLPEGTRACVQAVCTAMEKHAPTELGFLRRYQLHQDKQNHYTLRLRTVAPIPEAFRQALRQAWAPVAHWSPVPLAIVTDADIVASPSGKLLDFTSDLYGDEYGRGR